MMRSLICLVFVLALGCAATVPVETVQINQSAIQELVRHRQDDLKVLDQLEDSLKSLSDIEFSQSRQAAIAQIDVGAGLAPAQLIAEAIAISDARTRALYEKYEAIENQIAAYRNSPTLAAALRDLGAVGDQLRQLNEVDWQSFASDMQGQILELIDEIQSLRTEIAAPAR